MAILSKVCKSDNFEWHNSLKFSFTNIRGFRSNFVDCESFLGSNFPDIRETNLDDSIDSGNFSVRGYLSLTRNDSDTLKKDFLLHRTYLQKALQILTYVFDWQNKSSLLPRNLALLTFGEFPIVFSTKVNLLYFLYSTAQRCCLLDLAKQDFLLETSLRTLILMTQISLYLFPLLELI